MSQKGILEQLYELVLLQGKSKKTAKIYRKWLERFIRYHGIVHPRDLPPEKINEFLAHIHFDLGLSASSQNQALCALKLGPVDTNSLAPVVPKMPPIKARGEKFGYSK